MATPEGGNAPGIRAGSRAVAAQAASGVVDDPSDVGADATAEVPASPAAGEATPPRHRANRSLSTVLRRRRRQLGIVVAGSAFAFALLTVLRLVVPLPPLWSAEWLPGHARGAPDPTSAPPRAEPVTPPKTSGRTQVATSPGPDANPPASASLAAATSPPTPTPPPAPVVLVYEAESAQLTGAADTRPVATASGGWIAGHIGDRSSNTVRFTVNVPSAGPYPVTLFYLGGERRDFVISVNGWSSQLLSCGSTGGWDVVGSIAVTLELRAGANTIQLGNSSRWAPDLDRITVTVSPP